MVVILTVFAPTARAELLVRWDFNTQPPDTTNSFTTGSLVPIFGTGTAMLVGGATSTFASGGGSSDLVTTDDSAWNTAGYPSQGTGNKTRGVQFNVSTLGFQQIRVTWDHRHSGTASRYLRFQYSTNGTAFIDGPSLSTTAQEQFLPSKSVDLTSFPVVNNKSNFAFRIVAEFEGTAINNETSQYVATTTGQTYSPNGTWRFDMVTVSGEIFSGNEFPSISVISNQTIPMNTLSEEIPFIIGDFETPATDLRVSGSSSNPSLIPNENIFFFGTASNHTLALFPATDQSGMVTITVTVTDGYGNATSTSFQVTVLPDNTPPTISSFTNYHTIVSTALAPIQFTVGDMESAAGDLTIAGTSSNPALIPGQGLNFSEGDAARTLTITPATGQTGNAIITVTVSDGTLTASRQFAVMVVPSASVLLCDSFAYPDGPLNANSAFRWAHHSGIAGQTSVQFEELRLSSSQTEDISATLIGAPYAVTNSKVLYTGFTVNYKALPAGIGEWFAHFRGLNPTGPFLGRVFGTTTNAAFGSYRLAIGNDATTVSNAAVFPHDLTTDTDYLVVVRYDVGLGASTLWVNPLSEGDTNVVAFDEATPAPILAWAFRQSSTGNGSMGTLHVDDLKVGFSFGDVVPSYRLRITRTGSAVEISWPAVASDENFALESTSDVSAPNWQLVPEVPTRSNDRDHVILTSPAGNLFYRLTR